MEAGSSRNRNAVLFPGKHRFKRRNNEMSLMCGMKLPDRCCCLLDRLSNSRSGRIKTLARMNAVPGFSDLLTRAKSPSPVGHEFRTEPRVTLFRAGSREFRLPAGRIRRSKSEQVRWGVRIGEQRLLGAGDGYPGHQTVCYQRLHQTLQREFPGCQRIAGERQCAQRINSAERFKEPGAFRHHAAVLASRIAQTMQVRGLHLEKIDCQNQGVRCGHAFQNRNQSAEGPLRWLSIKEERDLRRKPRWPDSCGNSQALWSGRAKHLKLVIPKRFAGKMEGGLILTHSSRQAADK